MQSTAPLLTLGTRASPLAMVQAETVRARLAATHGVDPERIAIRRFVSTGDRLKDQPLSEVGGKGLFTKEIDRALAQGEVDIGVHSAKDVATSLPEGLEMAAFLEREDVRDAFVSLVYSDIGSLPRGARFGTSSIRRAAQLLHLRPDLEIVPFRGNVATRLQKLADGVAEATLLALAGLNRLGEPRRATSILDPERFMPAPAQGAIGLMLRAGDTRVEPFVAPLDHRQTHIALLAERAMLGSLDGSCRTPVGALSHFEDGELVLRAELLSLDGRARHADRVRGPIEDAHAIGADLGARLRAAARPGFGQPIA